LAGGKKKKGYRPEEGKGRGPDFLSILKKRRKRGQTRGLCENHEEREVSHLTARYRRKPKEEKKTKLNICLNRLRRSALAWGKKKKRARRTND